MLSWYSQGSLGFKFWFISTAITYAEGKYLCFVTSWLGSLGNTVFSEEREHRVFALMAVLWHASLKKTLDSLRVMIRLQSFPYSVVPKFAMRLAIPCFAHICPQLGKACFPWAIWNTTHSLKPHLNLISPEAFSDSSLQQNLCSPTTVYILALFLSLSSLRCDPDQGSGQSGGFVTYHLCDLEKVTYPLCTQFILL